MTTLSTNKQILCFRIFIRLTCFFWRCLYPIISFTLLSNDKILFTWVCVNAGFNKPQYEKSYTITMMLAVSYLTLTYSTVSISNSFSYMFCQNENSSMMDFYIKVFITFCFVNILIIKFIFYWLLKLLNITDNKLFCNSKVISDDFELAKKILWLCSGWFRN